jgi:hypothetical protein
MGLLRPKSVWHTKSKKTTLQFDGVILSLEEGTEVIEGVDRKINELAEV